MYKRVETDESVVTESGSRVTPLATLADEYGGRAQVIEDDHCLLVLLRQEDGTYKSTSWLFPEVVEVIRQLDFGVANVRA